MCMCRTAACDLRRWVEWCRVERPDMIQFIKYSGESTAWALTSLTSDPNLKVEDFILIIMSSHQAQVLVQCCVSSLAHDCTTDTSNNATSSTATINATNS